MTQAMVDLQTLRKTQKVENNELCSFMKAHKISSDLTMRVKLMLVTEWTTSVRPENSILALRRLPESLREDIQEESRAPHLCGAHDLFRRLYVHFPNTVREICCTAMTEVVSRRDDRLFSCGVACVRMLIINHGSA